jgi:uncharacterized protein (DUF1501 family)
MTLSRRQLLRWGAAASAFSVTSRLAATARVTLGPLLPEGSGNLLILQLSGGNDGLNTVVPYGDDDYNRARPTLAKKADELFVLDTYRGLHSNLTGLVEGWEAGELAIIEGCGYPDPNRSHFKSMDIWHTADKRGRDAGQGWIGRLADSVWGQGVEVNRIVHIGGEAPYSLNAKTHGCAAFDLPEGYRWLDHDDGLKGYSDKTGGGQTGGLQVDPEHGLSETGALVLADDDKKKRKKKSKDAPVEMPDTDKPNALDAMRGVLNRARESSTAVREAALGYRTPIAFPNDDLGAALRSAAALLTSGIGSRILSVTYGGFDTHNNERTRHDRQMRELGAALSALRADLNRSVAGRATTIMVFSEFGRRVTENGSGGTDHGTAGPMFVLGARVKGGLYGKHPKLDTLDNGDMQYTTDFRRVYTDVAAELFEAPRDLLGDGYKTLGLFKS